MRALLVSLALCACGGSSVHHLADSGGDAPPMVDAFLPIDAPPGTVSVAVTLENNPSTGVTVYFQNADSTLVATVQTDGSGVASQVMNSGGFVTVVEPQLVAGQAPAVAADNLILDTFSGVVVGDQLHVDVDPQQPAPVATAFTFTAPVDRAGSAAAYTLFTTCDGEQFTLAPPNPAAAGSNLPPDSLTADDCNGSADLFVESLTSTGVPLDVLAARNVAIASGSDIVVTGSYVPVASVSFDATDVPPEVSEVDVEATAATSRGPFFLTTSTGFDNTTGSGTFAVTTPTAGSGVIGAYGVLLSRAGTVQDRQVLVSWGPQPTAPIDIDIGATKLRSWVTAPEVDPVTQTLGWAVETAGTTPDFVVAQVRAERPSGDATTSWSWRVAGAASEDGALVFPTVPTDIFDFNFLDTDELQLLRMIGAEVPGGYDESRPTVFDLFDDVLDNPSLLVPTAPTGSAAYQIVQEDT